MTDPMQRPPVSRESHAERVARARILAAVAGKDIDDALAENAGNTPLRRARADIMLDRVVPGTTKGDYKAFDRAERQLKEGTGLFSSRQQHPRVGTIEDQMDSNRFYRKKDNPHWLELSRIQDEITDLSREARVAEMDQQDYFEENPHKRNAAVERDLSRGRAERLASDRAELAEQHGAAYSQVKQVGAQSGWNDSVSDQSWLDEEQDWDDYEAAGNQGKLTFFSPYYDEDLALENEPAVMWQEEVHGHRDVVTDYGEDFATDRQFAWPAVDPDNEDYLMYSPDSFPDPREERRTDGRPWSERRREVFPEDYDEHGNLLPGL